MRSLARAALALTLLGAGACLLQAQAAEPCHRPAPRSLIAWYQHTHPHKPLHYSPQHSALYHPISILRSQRPAVYWIGLAWLTPESGALFAVRCDGTPVDGLQTGAIGKLTPGPVLPELGQSVMFVYVNRETRACVHDAIQIAALADGKIVSLWEHGYNQGLDIPASGAKPRRFIAETYSVSFGDDGRSLKIAGVRAEYAYRPDGSQAELPDATTALPAESYRWDVGQRRFIAAKPYPQARICQPR